MHGYTSVSVGFDYVTHLQPCACDKILRVAILRGTRDLALDMNGFRDDNFTLQQGHRQTQLGSRPEPPRFSYVIEFLKLVPVVGIG